MLFRTTTDIDVRPSLAGHTAVEGYERSQFTDDSSGVTGKTKGESWSRRLFGRHRKNKGRIVEQHKQVASRLETLSRTEGRIRRKPWRAGRYFLGNGKSLGKRGGGHQVQPLERLQRRGGPGADRSQPLVSDFVLGSFCQPVENLRQLRCQLRRCARPRPDPPRQLWDPVCPWRGSADQFPGEARSNRGHVPLVVPSGMSSCAWSDSRSGCEVDVVQP